MLAGRAFIPPSQPAWVEQGSIPEFGQLWLPGARGSVGPSMCALTLPWFDARSCDTLERTARMLVEQHAYPVGAMYLEAWKLFPG